MRETISRILHEDTTLVERVRTLFHEQRVTLMSILTAVGMSISTLVLAFICGTPGGSTVNPQGGYGPAGNHWDHLLGPQHHREDRRMARRASVSSGGGRWWPAHPGCPRIRSA